MGQALTLGTVIQCPHGGTVVVVPTSRTTAAGSKVLTTADTFTVAGCPNPPSGTPSPCLTVEWVVTDQHTTMSRSATLSTSSVGTCKASGGVPQGTAIIAMPQARMKTT